MQRCEFGNVVAVLPANRKLPYLEPDPNFTDSHNEQSYHDNDDRRFYPSQKYLRPVDWNTIDDPLIPAINKPPASMPCAFKPVRCDWYQWNPT
jgi:hypothetical protein